MDSRGMVGMVEGWSRDGRDGRGMVVMVEGWSGWSGWSNDDIDINIDIVVN